MKYCNTCEHYRWIEDLYDNGTYVEYFYCEEDHSDICGYHHPACDFHTDNELKED